MSTVRRHRLAATALATTALLALGGCGTGFGAQTNQIYQPGIGANHRGEIDVLNTLLVDNADDSATLSAAVINNGDTEQTLSSVSVTTLDGKPLEVHAPQTRFHLPAGELTTLGGAVDAGIFQVTEGAVGGAYVKVTLTFSDAAPVTLEAPVVLRTAEYDSVASAPAQSPADTDADAEADQDSLESTE